MMFYLDENSQTAQTESIVKSLFHAFVIPAAICVAGVALFWSLPANAQSLNCALASTSAEFAICNDERLIVLDEKLEQAFVATYVNASTTPQQQAVTRDHSVWLKQRNACGNDLDCLADQYKIRIKALGGGNLKVSLLN